MIDVEGAKSLGIREYVMKPMYKNLIDKAIRKGQDEEDPET